MRPAISLAASSVDLLGAFWSVATVPTPTVIIGGGRWARVWLSVICDARGNDDGVVMVARTNPDDLRSWLEGQPQFSRVAVVQGLEDALRIQPTTVAAVVASRPRDHLQHGLSALDHGLHLLVEKPLTDRAGDGAILIEAAERLGRVLLPGTEFAFLPAFHECAAQLCARHDHVKSIRLDWSDPPGEFRYGAPKSRHDEVDVLADILPHAVSIFGVFAPTADFQVLEAKQDQSGDSGSIVLSGGARGRYELMCHRSAGQRRRQLTIVAAEATTVIDFAQKVPSFAVKGGVMQASGATIAMPSTLRLQWGAFLSEIAVMDRAAFIPRAYRLVTLQHQLEACLSQR